MFQFKQFTIYQDKCAMKVGTDGVLLGAWCPIDNNPNSVLDIGTGTGVIALMLAQRTKAEKIDAIEIDSNAFEQATDNFENSPWANILSCFHAGIDELLDEPEDEYDLIVCNPPFYIDSYKSNNTSRNLARFQEAMPFDELIEVPNLLLTENGVFAVIIPFSEEKKFIELCSSKDLFLVKKTHIRGKQNNPIIRSLLAFKRYELATLITNELIIEINRNEYTEDYIDLTKEFYLKM